MGTRIWPVQPGVPAAGHISRGAWHPGRAEGCPKCPREDDRKGAEKSPRK